MKSSRFPFYQSRLKEQENEKHAYTILDHLLKIRTRGARQKEIYSLDDATVDRLLKILDEQEEQTGFTYEGENRFPLEKTIENQRDLPKIKREVLNDYVSYLRLELKHKRSKREYNSHS